MIQLVLAHIRHKFKKRICIESARAEFQNELQSSNSAWQSKFYSKQVKESFQVIWILDEQTRLTGNF